MTIDSETRRSGDHSAAAPQRAGEPRRETGIANKTGQARTRERGPFNKIVCCSGHMIDLPDRPSPRFPAGRERLVRAAMAAILDEWRIGPGDLAITGGARGADILFAELCLERGTTVRLLIALPNEEFVAQSVRLDYSDWEARYERLCEICDVRFQHECLGPAPEAASPFERNNVWMMDTAQAEAAAGDGHVLVVWNGQASGDGPGGTSDVVLLAQRVGWRLAVVNPESPGTDNVDAAP